MEGKFPTPTPAPNLVPIWDTAYGRYFHTKERVKPRTALAITMSL